MKQTVKPELNNPEMKATYYEMHFGRQVIHTGIGKPMKGLGKKCILTYDNIERVLFSTQRVLELIPLDQITDEQAIACCRFKNEMSFMTTKKWTVERKEHYALISSRYSSHSFSLDFISGDVEFYNDNEIEVTISDTTKDYLRSIGMACPWLGNSVQELIEAGYCQLRKGGGDE